LLSALLQREFPTLHFPFPKTYPEKHEVQAPELSYEAQLSETGTHAPFELKTQFLEQARQTCLSQSQVPHPKSAGRALFDDEYTHSPLTTS